VALATALVLVALAIVPYLNTTWIAFEQDRSGAAALSGFSEADLRTATDAIFDDLIAGPPAFDVEIDGVPVLSDAERSHMRDVRDVFVYFYAAAAAALMIIVAAFWLADRRRSVWNRRDAWRGVGFGAAGLATGVVVGGVVALVGFDAAFAVFHRIFFAQGNYLFDPRTSRLVQLFPETLFLESVIAVGALILVLAAATTWLVGRRLRAHRDPPVADRAAPEQRTAVTGEAR
jgi:integral membrane protein (TIGR01906 family)